MARAGVSGARASTFIRRLARIERVLRHEAGLKDYGPLPAYHQAVAAGDTPWPAAELRRRAGADTHAFPPGQGWAYSNIGYLEARQRIETAHPGTLEAAAQQLMAQLGIGGA